MIGAVIQCTAKAMALAPNDVSQPVWLEADRERRLKAQEWEYTIEYPMSDEDEDAAGEGYAFKAQNKVHHLHWHQCSPTQNLNFTSMWRQVSHLRGDDGDVGPIGLPMVFHRQGYTTCKYILQKVETLAYALLFFLVWFCFVCVYVYVLGIQFRCFCFGV